MAETNPKDTKTVLYYIVGAVLALGILGYLATGKLPFGKVNNLPGNTLKSVEIKVGEKTVSAEIANTDSSRQTGLAGHAPLESNQGMLFVFPQQDITPTFWMKNVVFPIDIVWINDGKVAQVDTVQPELNVPDENLTLYNPGGPIDYVLELPANFMFDNGIKIGDPVDLSAL